MTQTDLKTPNRQKSDSPLDIAPCGNWRPGLGQPDCTCLLRTKCSCNGENTHCGDYRGDSRNARIRDHDFAENLLDFRTKRLERASEIVFVIGRHDRVPRRSGV